MRSRTIVFSLSSLVKEWVNPYIHLATALHCKQEVESLLTLYLEGYLSYRQLMDREAELFYRRYQAQFGHYPRRGDLEKLFPVIRLDTDLTLAMDALSNSGFDLCVITSGICSVHVPNDIPVAVLPMNTLLYSDDDEFAKFSIRVSGDKVEAFNHYVERAGMRMTQTVFVGRSSRNPWLMQYILELGGSVFDLDDDTKDVRIPRYASLYHLNSISDLPNVLGAASYLPAVPFSHSLTAQVA